MLPASINYTLYYDWQDETLSQYYPSLQATHIQLDVKPVRCNLTSMLCKINNVLIECNDLLKMLTVHEEKSAPTLRTPDNLAQRINQWQRDIKAFVANPAAWDKPTEFWNTLNNDIKRMEEIYSRPTSIVNQSEVMRMLSGIQYFPLRIDADQVKIINSKEKEVLKTFLKHEAGRKKVEQAPVERASPERHPIAQAPQEDVEDVACCCFANFFRRKPKLEPAVEVLKRAGAETSSRNALAPQALMPSIAEETSVDDSPRLGASTSGGS